MMRSAADTQPVVYEWLNLEKTTSQDIQAIADLEAELFGAGAWSQKAVEEELHAPSRYYVVARGNVSLRDYPIVGYAGLWFDGEDAQVMTIGVAAQYQGQHIGTDLMVMLKDKAQKLGSARLLLEVATDNAPALAVYEAAGFTQIGLRKRYYQPENKDAYVMACVLKGGSSEYGHPVGFSVPE